MSPRLKNAESKIAFGQLILRKIIKTVDTRCQILRLKRTKIENSAGGAYNAPQALVAGFKGPTSKGGERRGMEGIGLEGTEGKGTGRDGRQGKGGEGRQGRGGECCGVQKILKIDPALGAGAPPPTPLGELTAFPQKP